MQEISFELRGEFIELCNLLKLTGVAQSGGQGKAMVADGVAKVDGVVELRKTAKIRKNQTVECFDTKILIT